MTLRDGFYGAWVKKLTVYPDRLGDNLEAGYLYLTFIMEHGRMIRSLELSFLYSDT